MPDSVAPLLALRDIVMEFPSTRALDGVSIEFLLGEVHGIVGENGAGKSTLMRILSGLQPPTSGSVVLRGAPVRFSGVRDAQARGIAMIHQELNLVDELTVVENIFLGREISRAGLLNRSEMTRRANEALRQIRAPFPSSVKVGELSVAGKQLVEIAKAVEVKASFLIMDEPTAVLSEPESEALFQLIARLRAEGVTVAYVSHRLSEVVRLCDRVTVLRDGKWIGTVTGGEIDSAELARMMVGRPLGDFFPAKEVPTVTLGSVPALEVRGVRGASWSVQSGEILGLAGLVGAGRTELAEAVIGTRPSDGGEIRVDGKVCKIRSPKDANRFGIAYVSEDRKGLGLHTAMSSLHNLTIANLKAYGKFILDRPKEERSGVHWKRELDIRAGNLDEPVGRLSGGNQQKVAIGKWLDTRPKVLILDEPTRGVDVGAKRELYNLIKKLTEQGMACVVISSDLPEIIGLCHRVLVMREGAVVGELSGPELSEEGVMHLAAGVGESNVGAA